MATLTATQARDRISRGATPLDATKYNDTWVTGKIAEHDATFLRYRGELPDSATTTEAVRAVGVSDRLLLPWPVVTSITSVTINGSLISAADYYVKSGILYRTSGCFTPTYPATIVAVHGYGSPEDLKGSCAKFVEKSAAADRAGQTRDLRYSESSDVLVRPDWANRIPTGWAEVDRVWNSYPDYRLGIA